MSDVLAAIERILRGAFEMGLDVAPFLILGFLVAGALRVLLPDDWISRRLGGRGSRPVVGAALVGIPLPLCSCGVIPAALGLRKQGASRGATLSFLVSTPETGVDSIAVTYAILGPVLAIVRPVAAFVNAVTCGLLADLLTPKEDPADVAEPEPCACCGHEGDDHRHSLGERLRGALRFAFVDLMNDVAGWLLLGLLLAGVITAFVSPEVVRTHIGSEAAELLLMLVVSVPLYICATASTPVAAALVVSGFSPGAAIVLLLAGPATNIATLLMVGRFLGRAAAAVYIASIAVTSLTVGWIVNRLAGVLPMPTAGEAGSHVEALPRWLMLASAILLLGLMANVLRRRLVRRNGETCCATVES